MTNQSEHESYLGAKGGSGVYQAIINVMAPHELYGELFLGTGVIFKKKAPAKYNVVIDKSQTMLDKFNYHQRLLTAAKKHNPDKVKIIISGYSNPLYNEMLKDWWRKDFQAMTRGGVRTETIWLNYKPGDVHYHTFAGENFTDRQRIKRKAERWAKNFEALPPGERQTILAALLSVE
mgnify:CR=1 FL=1